MPLFAIHNKNGLHSAEQTNFKLERDLRKLVEARPTQSMSALRERSLLNPGEAS